MHALSAETKSAEAASRVNLCIIKSPDRLPGGRCLHTGGAANSPRRFAPLGSLVFALAPDFKGDRVRCFL